MGRHTAQWDACWNIEPGMGARFPVLLCFSDWCRITSGATVHLHTLLAYKQSEVTNYRSVNKVEASRYWIKAHIHWYTFCKPLLQDILTAHNLLQRRKSDRSFQLFFFHTASFSFCQSSVYLLPVILIVAPHCMLWSENLVEHLVKHLVELASFEQWR